MTECTNCGSTKLSGVIGFPSERRVVCYSCGQQYSVESWVEDVLSDVEMQNNGVQCHTTDG